jgi:LysM repeat protein
MNHTGGDSDTLQDPKHRFPAHLFVFLALLLGGLLIVSMARAEELPCGDFYTTRLGDDLDQIAITCNTSVPALIAANPGINQGDTLLPGQILRIPSNDIISSTDIILDTGSTAASYTVVSGDTLSEIAARHGISVSLIVGANPQINDPDLIYPGQVFTIPAQIVGTPADPIIPDTGAVEQTYTVRPGDTMSKIASRYGSTTEALVQLNPQIKNPDLIYPGWNLVISPPVPSPTTDQSILPDTGEIEQLPTTPEPPTIAFPTPTPTPTESPPEHAFDIIPETGEILYQDDLSVPGDWFTGIQDDLHMEYSDGGYRILNRASNSFVSSIRAIESSDIYVETRATRVGGAQTGYYGVVCRWQDISNYYAMLIGSDGFFGIARILNGQLTFLGEGRTTGGSIYLDTAVNLVGGSCFENTLTLVVNGQSLLQVEDQAFVSGYPGVVVATRTTPGTHVQFNDFSVRR